MRLNYYTKLPKQQGRAKAAKTAATKQLGRGRGEGLSPILQLLSQRLSDFVGENKESLPLWLVWRDPQSRKGGSRRAVRVPPLLAGVDHTQGTVLMTTRGKSVHVKQSRERNWAGWKGDACYELTPNELKKMKKMSESYRQIFISKENKKKGRKNT